MIYSLSKKIGKKWKRLARNLEIDDETIDGIDDERDNTSYSEKCEKVISEFNRKRSLKWNQMRDILKEIELENVIT